MSLGAWEDESPAAEYGHQTQLWQDMKAIEAKFVSWLAAAKKNGDFWCPDHEAKAHDIVNLFDELGDQMYGKL